MKIRDEIMKKVSIGCAGIGKIVGPKCSNIG